MVLHNKELVERILKHHSGCKKTLLSASLTSKVFSEPALNVLWYKINSIWPLFRILPTFERGASGIYLFTGPIRNEHLQRVLYYAKRIRCLDYKDVDNTPYSRAPADLIIPTFMRIDQLGAFVQLRRIHIDCSFLRNTVLFPLTAPNLESIKVMTRDRDESTEIGIASSLQSVAQSPLIKSLAINGPFGDITLQVIPDFVNLHRLWMNFESPDISVHFMNRLASSVPALRYLNIRVSNPRGTTALSDALRRIRQPLRLDAKLRSSFPSLETLHVVGTPTQLESLFSTLDAPLLKSISLALYQFIPDVGGLIHKFIQKNQLLLTDKVHKLIIQAAVPSLSFLNTFGELRELNLLSGAVSMSDIGYTFRYDTAWSRSLTYLHLVQAKSDNGPPIRALYPIAIACPNLKLLEISIHHPELPITYRQEREPHILEKLVFFNLPTLWPDSMALAIELVSQLDYLFPSMATLEYAGLEADKPYNPFTRREWWKGVQDMWRMCQTSKGRKSIIEVASPLSPRLDHGA